jgi:hypothetical protein
MKYTEKQIKNAIEKWNASGRCAYYHPRLQMISLNGMRALPVNEAIKRINETLTADENHRREQIEWGQKMMQDQIDQMTPDEFKFFSECWLD